MTLPTLLTHLEALCDAATPGPWRHDIRPHHTGGVSHWIDFKRNGVSHGDIICGGPITDEMRLHTFGETPYVNRENNARFIAALNPQTVKHLLAVCRAAHALGVMPTDSGVLVTHNEMKELTAALTNLEKAIGE
jgi:hypothetical protein